MAPASFLRSVIALVGVAGALGCECLLDPSLEQCGGDGDGGPTPDECSDGRCAITSPGCDGAAVERTPDQTCATCAGLDGDVLICGAPTVAECELRFDANGGECRYCATDMGEVLYDDCFAPGFSGELACEPAPAGPNDPVAPDMICQACRDERGTVVETRCEPVSDECYDEVQGDTICRICTADGQVVVQECQGRGDDALAPDLCEVYENDVGRCVDCWGNDTLLSHRCSSATAPVTCVERTTIDRLQCVTCFDTSGVVVEQWCSTEVPEPQQCQVLFYSEQTCVVCLDEGGGLTSTSCERNDCNEGGLCEPPPPCSFEYAGNDELCRSCPTDSGAIETQCLGESGLYCEELLYPDRRCTACYDTSSGVEVYRDCSGAPTPWCESWANDVGELCEVCYDPATGAPIYSSCGEQTCSYLGSFALTGASGANLTLENRPAVAECGQCASANTAGDPNAEGFRLSCNLLQDCSDGSQSFDAGVCPTSVLFAVAPRVCGNPWELAGYQTPPASLDELLAVLSFALERHDLALVSVDQRGALDPDACTECGCQRGDVLQLEVRAADAARASAAFEQVLQRCASDDDCGGGYCRIDGACSPP